MKTFTKQEIGRRYGVGPSAVTKWISRGLPVTGTGRINWAAAQKWHKANVDPTRSGSYAARHRKPEAIQPAYSPDLLLDGLSLDMQETAPSVYFRVLLDRILSKRNLVAGIFAEIGIQDPVLLHAVDDVFAGLVLAFAGDLDPYNWDTEDIPLVDTDIAGVFSKFGLGEVTQEIIDKADELVFAADKKADEAMTKGSE